MDVYLFKEGTHTRLYDKLGARRAAVDGREGVWFGVWAPNAEAVSVVGDFNGWQPDRHPLRPRADGGVWEGFVEGLGEGTVYKYHIRSRHDGYRVDKADPFAFMAEMPPQTASVVHDLSYEWGDADWMAGRAARSALGAPISIYEVHLGSWMRPGGDPNDPHDFPACRELAPRLAEYCTKMGFTHVELLPVMEHPLYRSWGYQTTGYFAATRRYGTPQDLMFLIDTLHRAGIGVILDWVPSHFPSDEFGLVYFDGTHLFEHADPRRGYHPDWKSMIFDYGRGEVASFLLSSAHFWMEKYHADGLRVDAVASMIMLDFSRKDGEWAPNAHGGRENLEAIEFLRRLNTSLYRDFPGTQTYAEDSSAWPMVTRPVHVGGLGFGLKWDMGWMHDALDYLALEPVHRKHHHNRSTFRSMYQHAENYVLPLSHDEVVHLKKPLLWKMPGDEWQRFANLRLLLATQWAQPGKKLLFMGGEFAATSEWDQDRALDWTLLGDARHAGVSRLVRRLNEVYRAEPALHALDCEPGGFEWVDANDADNSVLTFLRRGPAGKDAPGDVVLVALNNTPVPRSGYRVGVPFGGFWEELVNSDAAEYAGSGVGNMGGMQAEKIPWHGREWSLPLTLPPLAAVYLRGRGAEAAKAEAAAAPPAPEKNAARPGGKEPGA
jgi:1,4-alpha-glucan branching enzyme